MRPAQLVLRYEDVHPKLAVLRQEEGKVLADIHASDISLLHQLLALFLRLLLAAFPLRGLPRPLVAQGLSLHEEVLHDQVVEDIHAEQLGRMCVQSKRTEELADVHDLAVVLREIIDDHLRKLRFAHMAGVPMFLSF